MAIPTTSHRFLDQRGNLDTEWRRFFESLSGPQSLADLQSAIDALQSELNAIGSPVRVVGGYSVQAAQSNGAYYLRLVEDQQEPGFTYYYGTGPDGLKGWYPVADTVEAATGELTKAVDAEGVTTFGLDDTAVTPGTYTNATVTFDAKGRATFAESGSGGDLVYNRIDAAGDFRIAADGSLRITN